MSQIVDKNIKDSRCKTGLLYSILQARHWYSALTNLFNITSTSCLLISKFCSIMGWCHEINRVEFFSLILANRLNFIPYQILQSMISPKTYPASNYTLFMNAAETDGYHSTSYWRVIAGWMILTGLSTWIGVLFVFLGLQCVETINLDDGFTAFNKAMDFKEWILTKPIIMVRGFLLFREKNVLELVSFHIWPFINAHQTNSGYPYHQRVRYLAVYT